jgi:uncharacterized repeat protein (TIGR02543 family)
MPASAVAVTAHWTPDSYTVTITGSYHSTPGTGEYEPGAVVTIRAGSRGGYTFGGWTTDSEGVAFANRASATTTFRMPDNDVTVRANWRALPRYALTVIGGTGTGSYYQGQYVTIRATIPQGYEFDVWTTESEGVNFANPNNANTSFYMPGHEATVTATFAPAPKLITVIQDLTIGSYYFSPIDLMGADYKYQIVRRPATMGGRAPMINQHGQFDFGFHLMPVNLPRTGEYLIYAYDENGVRIAAFRIVVS